MASVAGRFLLSSSSSAPPTAQRLQQQRHLEKAAAPSSRSGGASASSSSIPITRRGALLLSAATPAAYALQQKPLDARERRNRKAIPEEDYTTASNGLKYYDIVEGKGPRAANGSTVLVHFDCIYRGITAVSSRESKLLAGNRIIAQPYEFKVGSLPGKERKREFVDNANGLFSAQAASKPPAAMYSITEGMRVGGKANHIR